VCVFVQDAALDAFQEQLEAEILGRGSLIGLMGHGFVVPCCYDTQLLLVRHVAIFSVRCQCRKRASAL